MTSEPTTRERLQRLVPRGAAEWTLATIAGAVLLVWAIGTFWVGSAMFNEHNPRRARFACEHPAGVFGTSNWQWWPPGRVCHYHDGTTAEPSDTRSVVLVVVGVTAVAGAAIALVYARRKGVFAAESSSADA